MTELKPCPFCGGEAEITDATRVLGVWNLIHRCTVLVPISCSFYSQEKAITAWNTRIQLAERDPIGAAIMRERMLDVIGPMCANASIDGELAERTSDNAGVIVAMKFKGDFAKEIHRAAWNVPLPTQADILAYALQLPEIKALVTKCRDMINGDYPSESLGFIAALREHVEEVKTALAALEPKP